MRKDMNFVMLNNFDFLSYLRNGIRHWQGRAIPTKPPAPETVPQKYHPQ
jgi:hypothetical protein